jgi:hypothetical protein
MKDFDPLERMHEYARRRDLVVGARLGFGVHGSVFSAESQTKEGLWALKGLERDECYRRERDVYLRLRQLRLRTIHGCTLPSMVDFDDELGVIQMTVVTRPFILDFAGAYLDAAPEFSEETLAEWQADKREQFGSRWSDVQMILATLAGHRIFVVDVNPNNISFGE